jgi:hypothetical protein
MNSRRIPLGVMFQARVQFLQRVASDNMSILLQFCLFAGLQANLNASWTPTAIPMFPATRKGWEMHRWARLLQNAYNIEKWQDSRMCPETREVRCNIEKRSFRDAPRQSSVRKSLDFSGLRLRELQRLSVANNLRSRAFNDFDEYKLDSAPQMMSVYGP